MNTANPPGLSGADIAEVVSMLPNGKGTVQIARYYDLNGTKHVVYDVLDGDGKHAITDLDEALTMDVEYPSGLVKWQVGSRFRMG